MTETEIAKNDIEILEKNASSVVSHSSNVHDSGVDTEAERSAVRRMDMTVLPVVTMFYLLSFLDRANIGNARVAGLQKSLHLTDHQFQIAVTAYYVPYIAAELPSNLLLRWIGPQRLMPTLLTGWGIIVTLQGLVASYAGLVTVRAFLGLVEGPMFPGIVLYLSGFYTRSELSLRIALFFSAASLSGAFSGLLAAVIEKMNGIGGRPGWAWIFILEGLFSFVVGVIGYFFLPSTPRHSKFLTEEQKDLIMNRLERDRPSINPSDQFSIWEVVRSLRSPQTIIMSVIFFMAGTTLFGLALFLPSIVHELGFSPNRSQLLSVGPFALGFCITFVVAYLSDKYNSRGIPSAAVSLLAVVGFAIYLHTDEKYTAYGSLYLTVPGVYACAPTLCAWMANNSEPYYRRATTVAIGFVATSAGGILSTWRFPTNEGPRFRKTIIMDLAFSALIVVFCLINMLYLNWSNTQKKKGRSTLLAPYLNEKSFDGGERAWIELGDRHPDFIYTL